jgi:hypothetical protein
MVPYNVDVRGKGAHVTFSEVPPVLSKLNNNYGEVDVGRNK